jgi:hypothetical protein
MTTLTIERRRTTPPPAWLYLLLLVAITLPVAAASLHASAHAEADQIRQCYGDGRLNQVWINSSGERFNCIVNLPDGRVGDRVMQWCKSSGWVEITAYLIGDGTLAEAVRVLKAKMCTKIYP